MIFNIFQQTTEYFISTKFLPQVHLIVLCLIIASCSNSHNTKVLFDFEIDHELDRIRWRCHTMFVLTNEHASHGKQSLGLKFFPSEYPGLTLKIKDSNWSQYDEFLFEVYNPEPFDIPLSVRIDDTTDYFEYNEQYNKTFRLVPGNNNIVIPLDNLLTSGRKRALNRKMICRVVIFMVQPEKKYTLYFDYFRLAKHRKR